MVVVEHGERVRSFPKVSRSIEELAGWLMRSSSWLDEPRGEHEVRFLPEDEPSAIEGTEGVWCLTPAIDDTMAFVSVVETGDEPLGFGLFTILLFVAGGTYIKQVRAASRREVVEHLDGILDWDSVSPPVESRRLLRHRESSLLPSTTVLDGQVDGHVAKVIVVTTHSSKQARCTTR